MWGSGTRRCGVIRLTGSRAPLSAAFSGIRVPLSTIEIGEIRRREIGKPREATSKAAPTTPRPQPSPDTNTNTRSEQQATGIERFELMGKVEGIDVFDMGPLQADRLGTLEDPIEVLSYVRHECSGTTNLKWGAG